jgi:kynurenine formamidase
MPLIDLTVEVKKEKWEEIFTNEKMTALGHLGTHFDGLDKPFELDYVKTFGVLFDVASAADRDIQPEDIDLEMISGGEFVIFHTGFLKKEGYGTKKYFTEHPQLSHELIQLLLNKHVAMIGIDAAGIRRGKEHIPADRLCADNSVFVVENIDNLSTLAHEAKDGPFTVYTFPIKFEGMSGLPCRVIAEI